MADITYVRLNGRFIYVCLLMDVFTRMIRAWQISQHLTQSLTLKPLEEALCHSVPEIHHSEIKARSIFPNDAYIRNTGQEHRIRDFRRTAGTPLGERISKRLIRTLKDGRSFDSQ